MLPSAVDDDPGKHGVQYYRLLNAPPEFRLLGEDGEDAGRIRLELLSPLDREAKENYTMTLKATDGGRPPLSGNATVLLRVLDSNDHNPVFEQVIHVLDIITHITLHIVLKICF